MKRLLLFLLLAFGVQAQAPTLLQVGDDLDWVPVYFGANGTPAAGQTYTSWLPNASGSGNLLTLFIAADNPATAPTIVDDKGNTWSAAGSCNDTVHGETIYIFYAPNAIAGTQKITTTIHSTTQFTGFPAVAEWSGVATTTPVDGAAVCAFNSSATSVAAGSKTPSQTGDLVIQFAWNDAISVSTGAGVGVHYTHGTPTANITWANFLQPAWWAFGGQWGVYSNTAALNPTFTVSTGGFVTLAAFFKAQAGAGTPQPSGIRVVARKQLPMTGGSPFNANPTHSYIASPPGTNLLAAIWAGPGAVDMTGVSDTVNGAWTSNHAVICDGTNQTCVHGYSARNATSNDALSATFTFNSIASEDSIEIYSIIGAASSPFDKSVAGTGNQTVSGNLTLGSLTPAVANELMITVGSLFSNTANGFSSPSPAFYDGCYWSAENISASGCAANNIWGHAYVPGTGSTTWTATFQSGIATSQWAAEIDAYKPAVSPSSSWSNILNASRAIDWTKAGLPATLPDGETTVNPWTPPVRSLCTNVTGTGTSADVTNIQNAVASCASGTYVALHGTFSITSTLRLGGTNAPPTGTSGHYNVTLRGDGAMSTFFNVSSGAGVLIGAEGNTFGGDLTNAASNFTRGQTSFIVENLTDTGNLSSTIINKGILFGHFLQCDNGFTPNFRPITFTTSPLQCSGAVADPQAPYWCSGDASCVIQGGHVGALAPSEGQTVQITGAANNGNGTWTITTNPGLYMADWSFARGASLNWYDTTWTTTGMGLEDITIALGNNNGNSINMGFGTSSWMKGVRVTGYQNSGQVFVTHCEHCLIANNYFFGGFPGATIFGTTIQDNASGDTLMINNISDDEIFADYSGNHQGLVFAYNYSIDVSADHYQSVEFEHEVGSAFVLREGNQWGRINDDNTFGSHNFETTFRNNGDCGDYPYQIPGNSGGGFQAGPFARFENYIGNVMGVPGQNNIPASYLTSKCAVYQGAAEDGFAWNINAPNTVSDPTGLTEASMVRWGNVSTILQATDTPANSGIRFVASENSNSANLSTWPNSVPYANIASPSTNLPCSMFMPNYTSTTCTPLYSGGTGLSWWKVCDTWATFPTSCSHFTIPPFPATGPDILASGGAPANYANNIPARIAFDNLPIDPTYQVSSAITSSSWSGGIETITMSSGIPGAVFMFLGPFQLVSSQCNPSGGELHMTSSTVNGSGGGTVSYALAANPGACTGTFKWPDVRQFDERVFSADSSPVGLTLAVTTDGAGSSHTGTAMTTALSYTNPAGGGTCVTNPANFNICYFGSTLTVTGSLCTSGTPCSWTLKDQNGTLIDTINTTAELGQVTPLGQIDCSGTTGIPSIPASPANTACIYNAPFEYPSTQLVTIGVTDGTTAASATVGFTYINNLNEYWTHRGRTLYVCPQGTCPAIPTNLVAGATINNIPWNIYANVTSPVTYQPLQTTFINTLTGNTEASIFTLSSDPGFGALVPSGAGSGIERPTMTYNGRWLIWAMDTPKPGGGSTANTNWAQQMNGSSAQILSSTCVPLAYSLMPEKNRPGWLLTNDATNLKVCDLDNSQTTVNIAAHGMGSRSSGDPQGFSYEGGVNDSLYFLDNVNSATQCNSPITTTCSVNLKTFDVSGCYGSLVANCATVAGSAWSSFIQPAGMGSPAYGWEEDGHVHCTDPTLIANFPNDTPAPNCEWHYHDIWFIPKSNTIAGLYGPGSLNGEAIFYQFPAAGGTIDPNQCSSPIFPSTTVVTCLSPNTFTNTPYWSHPAFNQAVNYLVAYAGRQHCGSTGGHTCNENTGGNGVTDMRTNTSIYFSANEVVGHSAWDGYDTDHFGHDGGFRNLLDVVNGCVNEALREVSISVTTSTPFLRMGCRPEGTVQQTANSYLLSPSQSSDATKLAWSSTDSQVINNVGIRIGWLVQTRAPAPPVSVALGSSGSARVQWTAATLNRETMLYWVYKQPSCTGNWTRLAFVTPVNWLTNGYIPSLHSYTDATLASGSNACYGVTSQEWSGAESGFLSNTIKITNNGGSPNVFSSVAFAAQGTVITLPAPLPVTGLAVAQKLICATACAAVNTPHAPTLTSSTSAGTITGTFSAMIVYGKCADFPNCNNFKGTLPSAASSTITLASAGEIRIIPNNNEMVGQDAIQLYLCTGTCTAASNFHLQTPLSCVPTLTVLNSTIVLLNNFNAASANNAVCFVGTYNASGAPPPTTNTAAGGYQLNWTDLNNPGDRYDQIYYREGAAVNVTNELAAQPFLIATPPVGTGNFYDAFPNPILAPANIHYAVVTKRMDGTRSIGICMTGAGVSENCASQAAVPLASVSPSSLTFSSQLINTTSSPQIVTVKNVGTANLVLGSPAATITGNFAISSSTCTANLSMVPNQTCQINVTFTPLSVGSLGGTLTINDNSGGSASTQQVTLSGTGIGSISVTLTPPTLAFGNQTVNTTSSALLVTLTNTGTQPVAVSQAQLFGTNFTLVNGTCFPLNNSNTNFTLPVGQSCNWGVTFSPTAPIAYTGTFQVTDNASGSPQIINLSGQGVVATITWSSPQGGSTYNFGNIVVGGFSNSAPLTLQNTGTGPLQIALTRTGANIAQFAIQSTTCASTLAAGNSCTVIVTFTPAAVTSYSAFLTETDSLASNSPQNLTLNGAGVTPAPQIIAPAPWVIISQNRSTSYEIHSSACSVLNYVCGYGYGANSPSSFIVERFANYRRNGL